MPKKKKYGNILDMPLSINLLSAGSEEWALQRDADLLLREKALFQEYGLTRPAGLAPDARKLIQMMARDLNIKGFMEKNDIKPVGRPTKWKDFNEILLLFARVRSMQQRNPEMDLRSVIRNITNKYYPKNNPKYRHFLSFEFANNLYTAYWYMNRHRKYPTAPKIKLNTLSCPI